MFDKTLKRAIIFGSAVSTAKKNNENSTLFILTSYGQIIGDAVSEDDFKSTDGEKDGFPKKMRSLRNEFLSNNHIVGDDDYIILKDVKIVSSNNNITTTADFFLVFMDEIIGLSLGGHVTTQA